MNSTLDRLAERRERLVAQASAQRDLLAQQMAPWRARLALADRGVAALRSIRRHPAMLLSVILLLAAIRPRRAGRSRRSLWMTGWRLGRMMFRSRIV